MRNRANWLVRLLARLVRPVVIEAYGPRPKIEQLPDGGVIVRR